MEALQTGQIIVVFLLGFLLLITLLLIVRLRKFPVMTGDRYLEGGHVADAVVLFSEEHQSSALQGEAYYKLQVHVKPVRGRNFVAEINVRQDDVKAIPQAGDKVSVRYSTLGRKRVAVLESRGF